MYPRGSALCPCTREFHASPASAYARLVRDGRRTPTTTAPTQPHRTRRALKQGMCQADFMEGSGSGRGTEGNHLGFSRAGQGSTRFRVNSPVKIGGPGAVRIGQWNCPWPPPAIFWFLLHRCKRNPPAGGTFLFVLRIFFDLSKFVVYNRCEVILWLNNAATEMNGAKTARTSCHTMSNIRAPVLSALLLATASTPALRPVTPTRPAPTGPLLRTFPRKKTGIPLDSPGFLY